MIIDIIKIKTLITQTAINALITSTISTTISTTIKTITVEIEI